MPQKYTAAHWGSYEIHGSKDAIELRPLSRDAQPSRIGQGWLSSVQDKATRIARPCIREGWLKKRDHDRHGDAKFIEVPWDEALDILAEELLRTIDTHGNKSIFAGSYGWASAGRFHHAQSQMKRYLNTVGGYVGAANTYSHAAAEVLLPYVVGQSNRLFQDNMTSLSSVAQHCELLVSFGGISARTAQIVSSGTTRHDTENWLKEAALNGCSFVNVSPLQSDMALELKAKWLAPRPGTDCALILSLAHEIFINGKAHRDFLKRCTQGADVFEAYVMGSDGIPKTADWASSICDIPADEIRDLAKRMTNSKTMINMAWALQRADNGEMTLWAGIALACVLGQIGRPGTGFAFGYGSTDAVGQENRLIPWPSLPQGRNPIPDYIPVARIADMLENPGGTYNYNGQERSYPHAKMVWWSGGNPFHHHQDLIRLDKLWQRPETVVVLDHSWTATTRRADIVLPTTTALERDDFMINRRDTAIVYMSAALAPYAEAKDDYCIFAELSKRTDTHNAFTEQRTSEQWFESLWLECQSVAEKNNFQLPSLADFKAEGIFDIPDRSQPRVLFADFVADPSAHPCETASGKIELQSSRIAEMRLPDCPSSPQWRKPIEWLGDARSDQLHLISGQPNTRLHSQNDTSEVTKTTKINGREACTIHPRTAINHGLNEGDMALLENSRGACLVGIRISEKIRVDCVSLATGAWLDLRNIDGQCICIHGNPNVLSLDKGSSSLSQGNIAHTTLVSLRQWDATIPEITVHHQPDLS